MRRRERGFSGLLIRAPLHFNIIAIFIAIFVALTGSLVWYNYSRNAELALEAADSLLQNVSEKVVEKTRNFLEPPAGLVRLTAELPETASPPDSNSEAQKCSGNREQMSGSPRKPGSPTASPMETADLRIWATKARVAPGSTTKAETPAGMIHGKSAPSR